jgi:F-type H+-transporting ATPase subunit epsilon
MARTRFLAEVLTPEGQQFADEVEMVSTKTAVGSIGLLAGHEPLLARLEPTELRLYRSEGEIVRYAQAEGYLQMSADRALILVEDAIPVERLNAASLQDRAAVAQRALDAAPRDSDEHARAAQDLRRAEVFLAIARGEHP